MEFWEQIIGMLSHRYIRAGEALTTYSRGDHSSGSICQHVRIDGWGKYAAVLLNVGAIRRDLIKKDANGNWFYRYDE